MITIKEYPLEYSKELQVITMPARAMIVRIMPPKKSDNHHDYVLVVIEDTNDRLAKREFLCVDPDKSLPITGWNYVGPLNGLHCLEIVFKDKDDPFWDEFNG